jgi:hypothetical protein
MEKHHSLGCHAAWILTVLVILTVATPDAALAYGENFAGWSADGSFYLITKSGMDESDATTEGTLCPSERDRRPATWPDRVPFRKGECTRLCSSLEEECDVRLDKVAPRVHPAKPSGGKETKREKILMALVPPAVAGEKASIVVTLLRDGAVAGRNGIRLDSNGKERIIATYWRQDRRQVAVEIGQPARKPAKSEVEEPPGSGPPTYVSVVDVGATGAPVPAARAFAAVDLLDAGADAQRLDQLAAVLEKAGFAVRHRGKAKTPRTKTDVYFAAGFEADAGEIAALAGLPAGAAQPLDWKSPYTITVAVGKE